MYSIRMHNGKTCCSSVTNKCWRMQAVQLTLVCAGGVLDAAEVPLVPDADGVVHLGEHQPGGLVVVERGEAARHTSEVLQATGIRCRQQKSS